MIPIVITGHGQFATSIKETIKYILGEQPNVYFVDFNNGMGNRELEDKLKNLIQELNSKQILFLTDLVGGTPFSTAVLLSEENPEYKIFGGCNMPMIISAIELSEEKDINYIADEILNFAKDNIILFNPIITNTSTDDENGI